jgi:hypothetical protein
MLGEDEPAGKNRTMSTGYPVAGPNAVLSVDPAPYPAFCKQDTLMEK